MKYWKQSKYLLIEEMLVRFGYTYAIIRNNGYENGMKSSLSACHRR